MYFAPRSASMTSMPYLSQSGLLELLICRGMFLQSPSLPILSIMFLMASAASSTVWNIATLSMFGSSSSASSHRRPTRFQPWAPGSPPMKSVPSQSSPQSKSVRAIPLWLYFFNHPQIPPGDRDEILFPDRLMLVQVPWNRARFFLVRAPGIHHVCRHFEQRAFGDICRVGEHSAYFVYQRTVVGYLAGQHVCPVVAGGQRHSFEIYARPREFAVRIDAQVIPGRLSEHVGVLAHPPGV